MITFTYKVTNTGFINWKAKWDGKHDEDWYSISEDHLKISPMEYHPFKKSNDLQDIIESHSPIKSEAQWAEIEREAFELLETGDTVASNAVTLALCVCLSDKANMTHISGNTDQFCYWQHLLGALCSLWD